MKKRISLLLVLTIALIVFALTGCTKETSDPTDKSDTAYQFAKPAEGDIVAEIVVEDFGSIYVKFFKNEAPKAVENFITHANEGYYDGVTFHRVINDFMIQGGDPDGTGYGGESIWGSAFEDEFSEKIKPYRGALCMANAGANTNGSQFFLVQAGPSLLAKVEESCKYYDKTLSEYFKAAYGVEYSDELAKQYIEYGGTPWLDGHHTVFGQIFEGYDVLDKIAATPVNSKSVPETKVVIKTIRVYTYGGGNGV